MRKPVKPAANESGVDESELERKLYSLEDMPPEEETQLYMSKGGKAVQDLIGKVKDYWNQIKPNNVQEAVAYLTMPAPYYLWKMPVEVHRRVNDILDIATGIAAAVNPEMGLGLGISHSVSQVIYGLKTGSGKHTGSGLVGIVEHVKKLGSDEHKSTIEKIEQVIEGYFNNFKPAYARA